jgi:hypothetical protein
MPDPRLVEFDAAVDAMKIAQAALKKAIRQFPDDPLAPRIANVLEEIAIITNLVNSRRKSRFFQGIRSWERNAKQKSPPG